MTIAIVGTSVIFAAAAATSATTPTKTTTTGNAIILSTAIYTGTFSSVSDNGTSNTWSLNVGPIKSTANLGEIRQHACCGINGKVGHTFTLTLTGADYPTIIAAEFSGVATPNASAFDKSSTGQAANDTHTSGSSGTLSQANELCYGHGSISTGTSTPTVSGSGWTQDKIQTDSSVEGIVSGYKIVSATTAQSFDWTMGVGNTASLIGTYKEASGGTIAIKTVNGVAQASVKTYQELATALTKTYNGVSNV